MFLLLQQKGICTDKKGIMKKHHATRFVILAGGSGSRLWPLSSFDKPKQFIPFLDSPTLLELTIKRITPLIHSAQEIVVVTHERYQQAIAQAAGPSIGNIMAEPLARNTGPALLYAVYQLSQNNQDPVVVMLPSDHFIPDQGALLALLTQACDFVAQEPYLAILGARPTRPATGYGYIQAQPNCLSDGCYLVQQFHEKPHEQTAQEYLKAGNYFWNMGIVVGRCSTFLQEFKEHAPAMLQAFTQSDTVKAAYEQMPSISIDVALLEKSSRVVVFPWLYEWYDVGNLHVYLDLHNRFAQQQKNQQLIEIKSNNNVISSPKKIVACIGVNNLCIVETDDALLISTQNDVELVKQVVEQLEAKRGETS